MFLAMLVFNLLKDYDPNIFKAGIFSISGLHTMPTYQRRRCKFALLIVRYSRAFKKGAHLRRGFLVLFPMGFLVMRLLLEKKEGSEWRWGPPKMTLEAYE